MLCSWAPAQGQDTPVIPDASTPAPEPPLIVRLEPLRAPPELLSGGPSDALELFVVIESDGRARLDDPLAPAALYEAIATALTASVFRPAQAGGVPVAARVRVRLPIASPQLPASTTPPPAPAPAAMTSFKQVPAQPPAAGSDPDAAKVYGARGRIEQAPPTAARLESVELRELPGAFGDPFRVIDALAGVVPALSGLPYVYVRGAPPSGTVYYYDDIPVPALFHLALGPAVIHPALIDGVDFYAGVAPARYGRYTGGVLAGGARPPTPPAAIGGEIELRLIDINGMLEAPIAGGSLRVAGRYGYPGPILHTVSPQAELAYWDYQTQLSLPLSPQDRVELSWFGSYDRAGSRDPRLTLSTVTLEFHRAELRMIRELGDLELGSALQFGYERSEFEGGMRVHSTRFGPRLWAQWRAQGGLRLRVGADMFGSVGDLVSPVDQEDALVTIEVPPYAADVAARSVMGAYTELSFPIDSRLRVDLGLRSDLWLTGSRAEAALDPRATFTYRSHPGVEWHLAAGLGHQPAVFLIPLPGLADVGLEHGLQEAIQSEAGVGIQLPAQLRLETQFYLQYMSNVILPDLVLEQSENCNFLPPEIADDTVRCIDRYPRANVLAYGAEVFLHRAPTEQLSGWLSYTLGWAEGHAAQGFEFTPSFDVRHLVNLVLQTKFGSGFSAGTRLHYRSGKMASETFLRGGPIRYEQRLPSFFRADLQFGYAWTTSWADLKLSLEWWNLTLAREATGIQCRDGWREGRDPLRATPCRVVRAPGLFLPNLGLRATF